MAGRGSRFVRGDICDAALSREVLPGHDAVVNFAAETHVDRSIVGAADFVTQRARRAGAARRGRAHGVGRVVHVSTDEVYGSIDEGSWTEASPLEPNSPYSAAKAGSDLIALAYAAPTGSTSRSPAARNNYGPYQFPEKVIPLFVTNLLDGKPCRSTATGATSATGCTSPTTAAASSWRSSRARPGEVYNIGGGIELSNRELTGALLDACGAYWDDVVPVDGPEGP